MRSFQVWQLATFGVMYEAENKYLLVCGMFCEELCQPVRMQGGRGEDLRTCHCVDTGDHRTVQVYLHNYNLLIGSSSQQADLQLVTQREIWPGSSKPRCLHGCGWHGGLDFKNFGQTCRSNLWLLVETTNTGSRLVGVGGRGLQ